MQQYVVKQNSNETDVVAGFYIKAKVVEVNGDDPRRQTSIQGVHRLRLELPIQLPIDHIEYHAKRSYVDYQSPLLITDFELVGDFYATVTVYSPGTTETPTELLVYGLTPVLFRGIPQVTEVALPQPPRTKKGKKK